MKVVQCKEKQFCYLTKEEIDHPSQVMQSFVEDVSLASVRKLIVSMRDICSTTDNVPYGNPKAREDLFYVTDKIIRVMEATFAQYEADASVAANAEAPVVDMAAPNVDVRQLRVTSSVSYRQSLYYPIVVPHITLLGKWLARAGFRCGDRITVTCKHRALIVTINKEHDKGRRKVRLRA